MHTKIEMYLYRLLIHLRCVSVQIKKITEKNENIIGETWNLLNRHDVVLLLGREVSLHG